MTPPKRVTTAWSSSASFAASLITRFQPPPDYHVRDLEEERRQKERSEIAVTHPESFAGPWKTRDANSPVTDGVLLWATTELRQSTEYLSRLQIKVYRRDGDATKEVLVYCQRGARYHPGRQTPAP